MSLDPYAKLLVSMYEFPVHCTETIASILTEDDIQTIKEAIATLENKSNGQRLKNIILKYYGIGQASMRQSEIGRTFDPPVTTSRVGQLRNAAERFLSENSTLRPLVELITKAGIEGYSRRVEITLSLPSPAQIEALRLAANEKVAVSQPFSGNFLLDCFPDCDSEKRCPTCRAKDLLVSHNLLSQVVDLADEWLVGPSNDWSNVSIRAVGFSARTINSLCSNDINTLGQVCRKTVPELLRTPNFGRKSLTEIEEYLVTIGKKLRS